MPKFFTRLALSLLLGLLLFSPPDARADHLVGSDITWKCLGPDSFKITATVYRDCNGIPFPYTPISVKPKGGCPGATLTVNATLSGGIDITPVCKRSCTRCSSKSCAFAFGIQQYVIEGTIKLPKTCCEFTVSWGHCCRSAGITTGPTWDDYYIESTLNRCTKKCDNSPYFTNPPVAIYCANQCITYNQGVNDDDIDENGQADSLDYSLTDPLQAPGKLVDWASPYSSQEPLTYGGFPGNPNGEWDPPSKCNGFHLDRETGDLNFKSTQAEVTVMAIKVKEFRKDSLGKPQLIGEIRRDLQIIIIECPDNRSPVITGIDCAKPVTMTFCANQPKCFTVCSFDPDIDDTVTMSWNNQIPGAKFTVEEGKKWPKGVFCWTPTNANVRTYPYRFVVTGTDNACPINGRTSKTFSLNVRPAPEGFIKQTVDKCGLVTLTAIVTNKVGIKNIRWNGPYSPRDNLKNVSGNPIKVKYKPKPNQVPSKYPITVTMVSTDGCETSVTDTVIIDKYVYADLGPDTSVCIGTPMKLRAKQYYGKPDYIYSWYVYNAKNKTWDQKVDKVKDQIDYNITADDDKIVVVKVVDGNGCDNDDTLKIHAQRPPNPYMGPDLRGCAGTPVRLDATKDPFKKTMTMIATTQWYKQTSPGKSAPITTGGTLDIKDSGAYWVLVTDSIGCTGMDSINVYFNPLVDVEKKTVIVCKGDSAHLVGGTGGAGTIWRWYDLRRPATFPPVSTTREYNFKPNGTTGDVQIVHYRITAEQTLFGVKCMDVDTQEVQTWSLPVVKAGQPDPQCIDNPDYDLSKVASSPGSEGVWGSKEKPWAITGNLLSPALLGLGTHTLFYTYTDPKTGCKSTDSTPVIEIKQLPTVTITAPEYRCMREGKVTIKGSPSFPAGTWYTDPDDPAKDYLVGNQLTMQFDPVKAGPGPHKVFYSWKDSKGKAQCDNDTFAIITVYDSIPVKAGSYPAVCAAAADEPEKEVVLNGTPAGGEWKGPGSAFVKQDPTTLNWYFDVKASGAGSYDLYYRVAHESGRCPDSATTRLVVNPLPTPTLKTSSGKDTFCVTTGQVTLNGTPGGGTYYMVSGAPDALKGATFSPAEGGPGSYVIGYQVKDPNGCIAHKNLPLTVEDTASVTLNQGEPLCEGSAYQITAKVYNAKNIVWTSGSDPSNVISAADGQGTDKIVYHPSLLEQGAHFFTLNVEVSNAAVCGSRTASAQFPIYYQPTASFTYTPDAGCSPLKVHFTNTSNVQGEASDIAQSVWTFYDNKGKEIGKQTRPGADSTVFTFLDPSAGPYKAKLEVTSKNGCVASVTQGPITVYESPRPDFIGRPTFTTIANPKIKFENRSDPTSVDDKTKWEWNFGDRYVAGGGEATTYNSEWTYHDTGKYTVRLRAINGNGCDAVKEKLLYIDIRPEIIVFVPNVFTPATEGRKLGPAKNNVFQPVISHVDKAEMHIYNRWGEEMYFTDKLITLTDPKDGTYNSLPGWDGTYKGQDAPMDVYVYLIKTTSFSGKTYKYTGTLSLLR